MPATVAQARDQMSSLFKAAMDAGASTLVQIYDDVANQPKPPSDGQTPWARFKIKHSTGGQASLSGAIGRKRYTRGGFVVVQLFTPNGDGLTLNDQIVAMIMAAYEGVTTSGGVWFKNVRLQEVGVDGPWFQTNVLADFEYDEVK